MIFVTVLITLAQNVIQHRLSEHIKWVT